MDRKKIVTAAILLMTAGLLGCSARETAQTLSQNTSQESAQPENGGAGGTAADKAAGNAAKSQGTEGFATPEDAVLTYLAALRNHDTGLMEDTFGEEPGAQDISRQFAYLCGLDQIPQLAGGGTVSLKDDQEIHRLLGELTRRVEETDLGTMEFLGFVEPELLVEMYSTEPYQKSLSDMARKFGGSRMDNRVAVIAVGSRKYMLFFDLIEKNGRWYNQQLGGILASVAGIGEENAGVIGLDGVDEAMLEALHLPDSAPASLPEYGKGVPASRTQGSGYDSPRQAAAAYLEGLKAGDLEQILSTFSVESYGEHYDLRAQAEYTRGYLFLRQDVSIPTASGWAKAVVSLDRKLRLEREILQQARAFYLCSTYFSGVQATQEDIAFPWEELPGKMELDSLEVLGYLPLETVCEICDLPQLPDAENARMAGICGAGQVDASVLVFRCGGETYALFLQAAEYGGRWYNSQIGNWVSAMLGISVEFKGTAPAEILADPVQLEELLMPVT